MGLNAAKRLHQEAGPGEMYNIPPDLQHLLRACKVLIVDDEACTRKVIRALLIAIGVEHIYDANDGPNGLEAIRSVVPDLVFLDWEMPGMDGPAFVRTVRSPGNFPVPNVPIVMLTGHGERWRVVEAVKLGVNEYLLKPVSIKSVLDRVTAVLTRPRPIIHSGDYYGPQPRRLSEYKPEVEESLVAAESRPEECEKILLLN